MTGSCPVLFLLSRARVLGDVTPGTLRSSWGSAWGRRSHGGGEGLFSTERGHCSQPGWCTWLSILRRAGPWGTQDVTGQVQAGPVSASALHWYPRGLPHTWGGVCEHLWTLPVVAPPSASVLPLQLCSSLAPGPSHLPRPAADLLPRSCSGSVALEAAGRLGSQTLGRVPLSLPHVLAQLPAEAAPGPGESRSRTFADC